MKIKKVRERYEGWDIGRWETETEGNLRGERGQKEI